jgi:hypothetical protein
MISASSPRSRRAPGQSVLRAKTAAYIDLRRRLEGHLCAIPIGPTPWYGSEARCDACTSGNGCSRPGSCSLGRAVANSHSTWRTDRVAAVTAPTGTTAIRSPPAVVLTSWSAATGAVPSAPTASRTAIHATPSAPSCRASMVAATVWAAAAPARRQAPGAPAARRGVSSARFGAARRATTTVGRRSAMLLRSVTAGRVQVIAATRANAWPVA